MELVEDVCMVAQNLHPMVSGIRVILD